MEWSDVSDKLMSYTTEVNPQYIREWGGGVRKLGEVCSVDRRWILRLSLISSSKSRVRSDHR